MPSGLISTPPSPPWCHATSAGESKCQGQLVKYPESHVPERQQHSFIYSFKFWLLFIWNYFPAFTILLLSSRWLDCSLYNLTRRCRTLWNTAIPLSKWSAQIKQRCLLFPLFFSQFPPILHISEWSTDLIKGSTCHLTLLPHLGCPTQKHSSVKMWSVISAVLYTVETLNSKGKTSRSFTSHFTLRDADLGGNFCEYWFCQPTYSLLLSAFLVHTWDELSPFICFPRSTDKLFRTGPSTEPQADAITNLPPFCHPSKNLLWVCGFNQLAVYLIVLTLLLPLSLHPGPCYDIRQRALSTPCLL